MSDKQKDEAFEKWCIDNGYSLAVIKIEPPKYYEGDTQCVHQAWNASRVAFAEELVKALEADPGMGY